MISSTAIASCSLVGEIADMDLVAECNPVYSHSAEEQRNFKPGWIYSACIPGWNLSSDPTPVELAFRYRYKIT